MLRNMRISMRSDGSFREDANDTYRTCPECGVDCPLRTQAPMDWESDGSSPALLMDRITCLIRFPTSGAEIEQVIKLGLSYAFGPVCS